MLINRKRARRRIFFMLDHFTVSDEKDKKEVGSRRNDDLQIVAGEVDQVMANKCLLWPQIPTFGLYEKKHPCNTDPAGTGRTDLYPVQVADGGGTAGKAAL